MAMPCSEVRHGPAVLQLRKWIESHAQLNLADFREAFISPTRELLLLLSYQCEALLLPLIAGEVSPCILVNGDESDGCRSEGLEEPSTSPFCSIQGTGSSSSSTSKQYPVICDVKSLAWGHSGDAYNQHEDAIFKELLVVSGNHGVTIHAFRCPEKINEMAKSEPDDRLLQGRWVDWGPAASVYTQQAEQQLSFRSPSYKSYCEVKQASRAEGNPLDGHGETKHDDPSGSNFTSKTWFRSFLTEVETIKLEDNFLARFPVKSSFPCSAQVVSFPVPFGTSRFLDFLSCENPVLNTNESQSADTMAGQVADACPFKCPVVFSSSSHRLIGMVLTLSELVPVDASEQNGQTAGSSMVVVAMVHQWGIQWACAIKLPDSFPKLGPEFEWTDFKFSEKHLLCLNTSGLILVWGATTGKLVANFHVLECCGVNLKPPSEVEYSKLLAGYALAPDRADAQIEQGNEDHEKTTYDAGGYFLTKRTFKKLMVTLNSTQFAAVDDCGVVYVICADALISEKYYSTNKLSHFQHCGLGILAGWKVAGSGIAGQRVFSHLSMGQGSTVPLMGNKSFPSTAYSDDMKHWKAWKQHAQDEGRLPDITLNGFSGSQKKDLYIPPSDSSSTPIRRVFLPTCGANKEDFICFSSFGITRLVNSSNVRNGRGFKIVHAHLNVASSALDDRGFNSCKHLGMFSLLEQEQSFSGQAIGCLFQGCLYLVSQDGLSIVLPSVSVSSGVAPVETRGYWQPTLSASGGYQAENLLEIKKSKEMWQPWKLEVLDRTLLYEGPEQADRICLENGWDLKIARMRHLQLALDYLKSDEIERSLEMLVEVNLAEDGILRLLFTAVFQILCKAGNDNEVVLASRFLALAACFATKMVRKYGLMEHKKKMFIVQGAKGSKMFYPQPALPMMIASDIGNLRRLQEMARFLEIIRNLQYRLGKKCRMPGQGVADGVNSLNLAGANVTQDESPLPILNVDVVSLGLTDALEVQNQSELAHPVSDVAMDSNEKLALSTMDSLVPSNHLDSGNIHEIILQDPHGLIQRRKMIPLENPKDMIARWEIDNLDLKTVVKDALHSGRLPLAVLQLHLQQLRDLTTTEKEPHDTFNEVRDVGRAIAYDLFLKGETGLAIATLQRLGEDVETSLRELVLGTVRRSLRVQIALEMKRYGSLGAHEWKILERISLIERLYPSSSFWGSYFSRQKKFNQVPSGLNLPEGQKLQLTCSMQSDDFTIECGEIDGTVIGPWTHVNGTSFPVMDEDDTHSGYWAGAATWSDAWDQRTMDRIVLDQPFLTGVHTLWESQLEYHICHNDWDEVSKLLDVIPPSLLVDGSLQISLDELHSAATIGCNDKIVDHNNYFFPVDELDAICIVVPNIKVFRFSAVDLCSMWLRTLMEKELARKFIFMKEYWDGTAEIVPLLARAGFIINRSISNLRESTGGLAALNITNATGEFHDDTVQALHKLVIYHCTRYNLPNLLDLYLDHHKLVLDNDSLGSLQEAAGESQWAKWLLLSRIKGNEYDASLSNARSTMSHNIVRGSNLSVPEIDEIICTVDDMAEGGGEMAALATLMYAPAPIQKCLCSGSVNRHCSSSAQCTLENLRPGLQHFPTLWRALVSACFGQDANVSSLGFNAKRVFGKSALSDYLNWRDHIFFSAGGDTSLTQMLPCWFSKAIRRLVQIFIQGPLGWQSLAGNIHTGESFIHRDHYLDSIANENAEVQAISWEAAIQKSIEAELYASSFAENGFGVEHHLHRGRALAAFNHLLGIRSSKLRSTNSHQEPSGASMHGQTNIQSDVQMLLAPLTQNEELFLSSVMPLAILHFEDSVLVASCAFLLELCGISASMLRVDVAALWRIYSFYKSIKCNEQYKRLLPKGSAFHAASSEGDLMVSLARALAEDYRHNDNLSIGQKDDPNRVQTSRQPSQALMAVLQHLEKASLPLLVEGNTCGSWLLNGNGNGTEFRSQQKDASQHWNLVTAFCQMHHLSLSTKYLAVLAKDNDWVGFLTEAQVGGFPFDVVIQVASEFSDPRLKIHILTVLRSMQSTRKKAGSSTNPTSPGKSNEISLCGESNIMMPVELFGILAECEKQKNPGEAILMRARDLRWSLLAMVASCFPDVSPLSCLTVWLEITAARETSSIKVNDISSQIANNVGAAVEATNALPTGSRVLAFHYNRRNPKRRRLTEQTSGNSPSDASFDVFSNSSSVRISPTQKIIAEEARKQEADEQLKVLSDPDEGLASLSKMVAVLCEQHLFLPLLRAFEMFLPSCSLLPFIRSLQAFSQMRLSEAAAHLASFSSRIKEERHHMPTTIGRDGKLGTTWISSTAVEAADAMISTCPSAYEKRCLLQLLAAADFGDGGSAAAWFGRLYWKINLAEPSLRKSDDLFLGNETLDDASLLTALEKNGVWEQARNWARQLESSSASWKSAFHHVTETQAEGMVSEWKEFLWDVPEERAALWGHCQTLFIRYSFPALQAGSFFLKHAEAIEKDIPLRELHEMLLLALQWLSGTITQTNPVYPLNLLREIETRVWLLAVESEAQVKSEGDLTSTNYSQNQVGGNSTSIIEKTASIIAKMDNHLNAMKARATERGDTRENNQTHLRHPQVLDGNSSYTVAGSAKMKRRPKSYLPSRRSLMDTTDRTSDIDDISTYPNVKGNTDVVRSLQLQDENVRIEASFSGWEERVGPAELERAVLSLLEFGQITAAKQLQQKLSPLQVPSEFALVDAALKLAAISTPSCSAEASAPMLDPEAVSVIQLYNIEGDNHLIDPMQVLEMLVTKFCEGCGRGLCKRIIAVVKAANILGLSFAEAFGKQPIELLQLLSLKAQDSLEEAKLLVQTHFMAPASIAQILAESFLKGLLAAHRGGYMDSQKEEGPAPLLWRLSDFLKWAELCPSEPEIGHALMRLVITGQEIPHACEVELLIMAHHFYKSSACLDGVDVLVALAANRVDSYVSEGDFSCLARLVTGVGNFHALNFILGILIENGQLDLLLHKYSAADTTTGTVNAVRGFRMAVLTALKHFNPHDLDAFAMVYNHFDMKHETASLLESRATQSMKNWLFRYDREQNEDLLESMRYFIEAAEVHSTIDAGNKTRRACAQASLLSLQIRMPDIAWLNLSETNARRALVEQSRFQEALIVAEAYGLNQPSEWALVLWNQMLKPELTEQFVAEFVAVLPLQPSMLAELARFYRSEVAARGDQSHFSVWLSPGGLPAEWVRHLGRSFRSLLKRTRDLKVRMQLATVATGFGDVIDACMKAWDKVPDTAGPLILRKGHGGAYLPLM